MAVEDPTIPVVFLAHLREYGIRVLDGGSSYIQITHCPWCRRKLPASLRTKRLAEIRALGLEPGEKKIPRKYSSEAWYAKRR